MTFPFMPDPVPPGHGEADHVDYRDRSYVVLTVLGDEEPEIERRFGSLKKALEYRDMVRLGLAQIHGYDEAFVGVQDEDDSARGWLTEDDVGVSAE